MSKTSQQEQLRELSRFPHVLCRVLHWGADSATGETDVREPVTDLADANVITSRIAGGPTTHTVMLDLDVPAKLVPSSTEGHSHLYIDVEVSWRKYRNLLRALAEAGVIEPGYCDVSIARRCTTLRLPWIRKEAAE